MTADIPGLLLWLLVAGFATGLAFHRRCAAHRIPVMFAVVLWIAPVLLIQRVAPFPRVWLFLLPLSLMVACGGLWLMVRTLVGHWGPRARWLPVAIALACFLLVGGTVIRSDSVRSRPKLSGIKELAAWMKGRLKPQDVVLAKIPSTAPLSYYFRRQGIQMINRPAPCDGMSAVYSSTGFYPPNRENIKGRILAIVCEQEQTLESVLAIGCLENRTTADPRLIYRQGGIELYETSIDPDAGDGR